MRLTLDLDNLNISKVESKAKLLKIAFPKSKIQYRISSSGKGGHVELFDNINEIDEELMYNIRRLLGDHDLRINIDLSRGKRNNPNLPKQVLFDFKIKNGIEYRASNWQEVL